jgi:tetratricopeptide (TPR) repeat protein
MVSIYLTSDKRLDPRTYVQTWPLWIIAVLYVGWRLTAAGFDGPASYARIYEQTDYHSLKLYSEHFDLRFYTFLATLPDYLQLLVWPTDLHMERSFSVFADLWLTPVFMGAGILLLALGHIVFGRGSKNLPLSWGLLWFGASHFPDTGLLVPINSLFLEHWMYLPTAGLFPGIAQTVTLYLDKPRLEKLKPLLAGICLIVAAALGTATFIQNQVWHDPVTFYTHLFHYGVNSARAHNNLALAYMERREYTLAIEEFHKAIATSDTYAETRHNLAVSLLNLPDRDSHVDEAIANLNRALEIDPNFYRSYIVLSQVYAYLKDRTKADFYRQKAEALLNKYEH